MSYFVFAVYLFLHVSKLSEFIQSDVPSNTLLLIPNEFGTVFERLERLEELEIQYSQPERETISHNRLLQAITFKATRIAFCLPVRFFITAIRSLQIYSSITTLVHRTTVHM